MPAAAIVEPPVPSKMLERWGGLVFGGLLLVLYVLGGFFIASNIHHRLDPSGAPLFYDFSAFYQAAAFARDGHALAAYSDQAMVAAEQAAFPGTSVRLPWNYPPTFQLILTPLASLSYTAAWLVWTATSYGAYALFGFLVAEPRRRWLVLLAPVAAVNILMGQNGLLSVALLAGGALLIGRRPILGGLLIGLMAYKPHLAILAPLALISGREWKAFAAAAVSAMVMAAASLAAFGLAPWLAFLHKTVQPGAVFTTSSSAWRAIPSVLVLGRSLGLTDQASTVAHWTVAAAAAAALVWVWWTCRDARLRAASLATATVLFTPYIRVYDLALLVAAVPLLIDWTPRPTRYAEQATAIAAWLLPAVLLFYPLPFQVGPLVPILVLALILWRARAARRVATDNRDGLKALAQGG